jgi:hypothetical protein
VAEWNGSSDRFYRSGVVGCGSRRYGDELARHPLATASVRAASTALLVLEDGSAGGCCGLRK